MVLAVAFGVTVIATRVFLALTGYPQIGNDTLHIAHALWGGLLLAVAVGALLLYANTRLLTVAALLGGVGTGLFIDEVGKLISRHNDYFFPLAAPLIYVAVLGAVAVARHARTRRPTTPRERMYVALSRFDPVLDATLTTAQRDDLDRQLRVVAADPARPDLADLATELRRYLSSEVAVLAPPGPHRAGMAIRRLAETEQRLLPRGVFRAALVVLTALLGLAAVGQASLLVALLTDPSGTRARLEPLVTNASVAGWKSLLVLAVLLICAVLAGISLLACSALLLTHRDARAVTTGRLALLAALTVVNPLGSYFDVERVVFLCLVQLAGLAALLRYAHRFVAARTPADASEGRRLRPRPAGPGRSAAGRRARPAPPPEGRAPTP